MSINNHFNGKRFLRLLQHDFRINKKTYFWTLAAIILILFSINYIFLLNSKWESQTFFDRNYFTPFLFIIPLAIYITGTAFSELKNEIKAQNFMLLPGSIFEKFFVQFLIRIVFLIPIILVVFWSTSRLAKSCLPTEHKEWQVKSNNYDNFDSKGNTAFIPYPTETEINYQSSRIPYFDYKILWDPKTMVWEIITMLAIAFVSLFVVFAGTIYFKNFALVKSLVIIAILSACWLFAISFYNEYLISKMGSLKWQQSEQHYILRTIIRNHNLFLLWVILAVVLLLSFSYFKLKEKEV
jgi:hypothetical protein